MPNPFAEYDAVGLAELVRSGEISPLEAIDGAIQGADEAPELNAVVGTRRLAARAKAMAIRQSETHHLCGVPFLMSDCDTSLAGDPVTFGSRHLEHSPYVPTETSTMLTKLMRAGAVPIGRGLTSELTMMPFGRCDLYGASRNPWNLDYGTGGSPGGGAAAVAAGIVPFALSGDGGGALRSPASYCGLVGMKPSRGLVSLGPERVERWGGINEHLGMTRSVRDLAMLLDVCSGYMPGDPSHVAPPERGFSEEVGREVRPLRIAWTFTMGDGSTVDPEIATVVHQTAELLESLGHRVLESTSMPMTDEQVVADVSLHYLTCMGVWTASDLDLMERWTNQPVTPDTVEATTWALGEQGRRTSGPQYADALEGLRRVGRLIAAWWDDHDLILSPTVGLLPTKLDEEAAFFHDPLEALLKTTERSLFVVPFNLTGGPAISLPIGMSSTGLPIGVQLAAYPGSDSLLIRLAAQLEEARPWKDRRPNVWVGPG
jgi:Asp-tRNA(Asn)/Glu-tRNA(Gln) amidotransferase A subunit family amidase